MSSAKHSGSKTYSDGFACMALKLSPGLSARYYSKTRMRLFIDKIIGRGNLDVLHYSTIVYNMMRVHSEPVEGVVQWLLAVVLAMSPGHSSVFETD